MMFIKKILLGITLTLFSAHIFAQENKTPILSSDETINVQNTETQKLGSNNSLQKSNIADISYFYDFEDGAFPSNFFYTTNGTFTFDEVTYTVPDIQPTLEESSNSYLSGISIRGATISDGQASRVFIRFPQIGSNGGTFQYRYSVSSESGYDKFRVCINGNCPEEYVYSGIIDWTLSPEISLAENDSSVSFIYYKDGSESIGLDTYFVDNISIVDFETDVVEPTEEDVKITKILPSSGVSGTEIAIYGSGFTTATANTVSFGNVDVAVTAISSTKLIVEVPESAVTGTNSMSVSNANGDEGFAGHFTVLNERENIDFTNRTISASSGGLNGVYSADLNNDGNIDIVSLSQSSDKVVWFENLGSGNFSSERVINSSVVDPYDVQVADLDDDGDLDVFHGSITSTQITWYPNNGNETFSSGISIFTGSNSPRGVHAADIDGDGDLDLLAAALNSNTIFWRENLGDGDFSGPNQTIDSNISNAYDITTDDLDNDGDLDVISSANFTGNIYWHRNNGDGSFQTQSIVSSAATSVRFIHTADLNGDGDVDILSTQIDGISFHINDGNGSFETNANPISGSFDAQLYDFDGDGDIDFALTTENPGGLAWIENNNGSTSLIDELSEGEYYIAGADFDNDGDIDIVATHVGENSVYWYENVEGVVSSSDVIITDVYPKSGAPGTNITLFGDNFSATTSSNTVTFEGTAATVVSATATKLVVTVPDIETELSDIAVTVNSVTSIFPDPFAVLKEQSINFSDPTVITEEVDFPTNAITVDLNKDGKLDLLSISLLDNKIAWYEGNDGVFGNQVIISEEVNLPTEIKVADINANGSLDILVIADEGVYWIEGNGDGTFGSPNVVDDLVSGGKSVFPADLDNDGDLDIIATETRSNTVNWYENNGNGVFGDKNTIATSSVANTPFSVVASDFNLDGSIDIAFASKGLNRITILQNSGNTPPAFTNRTISNSETSISEIALINGDNDSDNDLVVRNNNYLSYFRNNGSFSFTRSTYSSIAIGLNENLLVSDVDGDGFDDIITSSSSTNEIIVYKNSGIASFSSTKVIATPEEDPSFILSGDIDDDGDLDVIYTSDTGDYISLIESTGPTVSIATIEPKSAVIGETITLRGVLFSETPSENIVTISGVQATVSSATNNVLEVILPSSLEPGNAKISVSNETGSYEYPDLFSVLKTEEANFDIIETLVSSGIDQLFGLESADLNGDLNWDLIVASKGLDRVYSFFGTEENGFNSSLQIGASQVNGVEEVTSADFDDDGDIDIATVSVFDSRVMLHINNGNGTSFTSNTTTIISTAYSTPRSIKSADIDLDGDVDVVVAYNAGVIAWFENLGDGLFNSTPNAFPTGLGSIGLLLDVADIDNDGDIDILSGSVDQNRPIFYTNNGDGSFDETPKVVGASSVIPTKVFAVDLNGDNFPEILTLNSSNNTIAWYTNSGGTSFSTNPVIYQLSSSPVDLTTSDFNGNGNIDIVVAETFANRISWFKNNGSGNFSTNEIILDFINPVTSLHSFDAEGDGDNDIFVSSTSGDRVSYIENLGPSVPLNLNYTTTETTVDLTWEEPINFDAFGYNIYRSTSPFEDISSATKLNGIINTTNTFSDNTVIAGTTYYYRISAIENGTNEETGLSETLRVKFRVKSMFSVSKNAGLPFDLITVYGSYLSASTFQYSIDFINESTATSSSAETATENSVSFRVPNSLSPGSYTIRITIDSKVLELPQKFTVLFDDSGNFRDSTLISDNLNGLEDIITSDVNNDGALDLIVAASEDGLITVYLNNGNGVFGDGEQVANASGVYRLVAGDINGDSNNDIIYASLDNNVIAWLPGKGDGTFLNKITLISNVSLPSALFLSDVDNDSDLDVLYTDENTDRGYIIINRGDGVSLERITLSQIADVATDIIMSDLNTDGLLDIIHVSYGDDKLSWYRNDGANQFTAQSVISVQGNGVIKVVSSDINRDGFQDLVTISELDNEINWYLNDGNGVFTIQSVLPILGGVNDLNVEDLTGDGFPEIIVSSSSGNLIGYHENLNGNSFSSLTIVQEIEDPSSFTLGDFDKDGDFDIVGNSFSSNKVILFENLDSPPAPPADFTVTKRIGKAELSWSLNTEPDMSGYYIYRSENQDSIYSFLEELDASTTNYSDVELKNRNEYFYFISAFDTSLNQSFSQVESIVALTPQVSRIQPNNAVSGERVRIFGVGFSDQFGQTSVSIGGESAAIQSVDSTIIEIEIPSGVLGKSEVQITSEGIEHTSLTPFEVLKSGDGTFTSGTVLTGSEGFTNSNGNVIGADIDNDGDKDVVVVLTENSSIQYFPSSGGSQFGDILPAFQNDLGTIKKLVQVNLFDENYPDFVSIPRSNNRFDILRNNGSTGSISTIYDHATFVGQNIIPEDIQVADMNNDGANDIIIASSGDSKINWYQNLTLGDSVIFSSQKIISQNAAGIKSIYPMDYDLDGDTDILATTISSGNQKIVVYRNNGDETFTEVLISNAALNPIKALPVDIDNDGDEDVISISTGDNKIAYYINTFGVFGNQVVINNSISGLSDIVISDVDGDGLDDIFASSTTNGNTYLLRNNGSGSFGSLELINEDVATVSNITSTDIDNDGDLDFISKSFTGNKIVFHRNITTTVLTIRDIVVGDGSSNSVYHTLLSPENAIGIIFNEDISQLQSLPSIMGSQTVSLDGTDGNSYPKSPAFNSNDDALIIGYSRFYPQDVFSVNIDSEFLYDQSEGEFLIDGNSNGIYDGANDNVQSHQITVTQLGDYNISGSVDFDDLISFSNAWQNNSLLYELAPFDIKTGFSFPRVKPNYGTVGYDIEDLITFIRLWDLSQANKSNTEALPKRAKTIATQGNNFGDASFLTLSENVDKKNYSFNEVKASKSYSIKLNHPDTVYALEIRIEFDPQEMQIDSVISSSIFDDKQGGKTLFLSHVDSINGTATLNLVNYGKLNLIGNKEVATLNFSSKSNIDSEVNIHSDIRIVGKSPYFEFTNKSVDLTDLFPTQFKLSQNYPNPFNPSTTIEYELAEASKVSILIYDVLGRNVATLINQDQKPGYYRQKWDASRFASGMYLYMIRAESISGKTYTSTKKMLLIK